MFRRSLRTAFVIPVALFAGAAAASADDASAPSTDKPATKDAADSILGLPPIRGTLTSRYRFRTSKDGTDQDVYEYLDLHVGDEAKDPFSATLFTRAAADLDRAHRGQHGFVFESIDDTFDKSVNALLYTAYATIRPQSGPFETLRLGRQYVYAAETFHLDGASVTTRPIVDSIGLKMTAYGGVPVHFYESRPDGDSLAGARFESQPWKSTCAAIDFTHDQDRLSYLSTDEKNDLAALSLWQGIGKNLELYGQFQWLDGPRDATLRATWNAPQSDLLVQASYFRLVEKTKRLATEFDPYTSVLEDQERYHQLDLRASKGLGDHFDVEAGSTLRRLLPGRETSPFNRDVNRVYVTPSMSDLPWKGCSVSLTGETYSSGGETIRTWAFDASHRFAGGTKLSFGSDYTLYGFGPLGTDERSHVRTAYVRIKFPLSKRWTADIRSQWEKDDVETFHVLTLALVVDF